MLEYIDGAPDGYRPGVCNIGPAEIRRRRDMGLFGVAAAIGLASLLLIIGAPQITAILVALPVGLAFEGLIQARLRFCAGYGMAGLRNLGNIGDAERITDPADLAADRQRALLIHAASTIGALGAAGILAVLLS